MTNQIPGQFLHFNSRIFFFVTSELPAVKFHSSVGVAESRGGKFPSPGGVPEGRGGYEDIPGFCKAATHDEVRNNNFVLMPGLYVGTEAEKDDGVLFSDKIAALTTKLAEQLSKGHSLETEIRENLKRIRYEF